MTTMTGISIVLKGRFNPYLPSSAAGVHIKLIKMTIIKLSIKNDTNYISPVIIVLQTNTMTSPKLVIKMSPQAFGRICESSSIRDI